MPMRNQAYLDQLRPDGARNQTQSDAIRRNQTQSDAIRRTSINCGRTAYVAFERGNSAPGQSWLPRTCGEGGGAVVSTLVSARPVVMGAHHDRAPCQLQSRGNQEAISRQLTTHHDRAPCGLGSKPLVESGRGGVARSARRVDLKVA